MHSPSHLLSPTSSAVSGAPPPPFVHPSIVVATFPAPPSLSLAELRSSPKSADAAASSSSSQARAGVGGSPGSPPPRSPLSAGGGRGSGGRAVGFVSRMFSRDKRQARANSERKATPAAAQQLHDGGDASAAVGQQEGGGGGGGGSASRAVKGAAEAGEEQKQPLPSESVSSSSASALPAPSPPSVSPSPSAPPSSRGKKSSTVVPTNGHGPVHVAVQPAQPAQPAQPSVSVNAGALLPPAHSPHHPGTGGAAVEFKDEPSPFASTPLASSAPSTSFSSLASSSPSLPSPTKARSGFSVQLHPVSSGHSSLPSALPPLSFLPALPLSSASSTAFPSPSTSDASPSTFAVSVDPVSSRSTDSPSATAVGHAHLPSASTTASSPTSASSSLSVSSTLHAPRGSFHRTSIAQYIDAERRHAQEQQYHLHKKRQHQLHTADASSLQSLSVVYLPRGGIYVHTPAGPIQFGLPPETIKDSMRLGLTLPSYFIIPKERFNLVAGINVAEFEFPAYYNFFFKRRRINLICTRQVEPLIRTIFTETLLGPSSVEWPAEYGSNCSKRAYPDLAKEMSYFRVNPFDRTPLTVDTLLAFTHFDEQGRVHLDHGVCIADVGEEYVVTARVQQEGQEDSVVKEIARLRQEVFSIPVMDETQTQTQTQVQELGAEGRPMSAADYFVPPHFGVTMLGNSDGFDSAGTTTGFVLWMNRRGIMVDPPPHSGALLKRHGISARLMRGVILTHCHADHDAGTFQKILEEGKVVLMTTEVILDSFLRKYSAISGLDAAFLRKLFVFRPVLAGQRTAVYGGHVEFFYSLHSIPCVGFAAYCGGKSMVYSGDSFNDPAGIQRLYEQGYVSEGRRDALINFPWHHDLILHEAGVPPIHTPLATLEALPADVKQRLFIVHKPSKDVPMERGLQSALVGPAHTLVISSHPPANASALEVLDLLSSIDMFSGFDLSRALEMLQCATFLSFHRGDTLIHEGTFGSTLYVIAMGTVRVSQEGAVIKELTVGDHFGEMSIVTGEKRTASIHAVTPVEVIQFSKDEFLYIVRHTDAIQRLQQLGVIQRSPSWQAISANSSLSQLSSAQKTYLQSLFIHRIVRAGEVIWQAGETATEAVLIADGQFYFSRAKEQAPFTRGALVGDMKALIAQSTLSTTLLCQVEGSVYAITRVHLLKFFDDNPGVKITFMNRRFIE